MLPIKDIIEALKLAPIYAVILLLVCVSILLAPDSVPHVCTLQKDYGHFFLLGAIIGFTICLVRVSLSLKGPLNSWRKFRKECYVIRMLTDEEKGILSPYLGDKKRTHLQDVRCGVVGRLYEADIIYPTGPTNPAFLTAPYSVTDWAWRVIQEKPRLIAH